MSPGDRVLVRLPWRGDWLPAVVKDICNSYTTVTVERQGTLNKEFSVLPRWVVKRTALDDIAEALDE